MEHVLSRRSRHVQYGLLGQHLEDIVPSEETLHLVKYVIKVTLLLVLPYMGCFVHLELLWGKI